jgi:hypothetical protein
MGLRARTRAPQLFDFKQQVRGFFNGMGELSSAYVIEWPQEAQKAHIIFYYLHPNCIFRKKNLLRILCFMWPVIGSVCPEDLSNGCGYYPQNGLIIGNKRHKEQKNIF